VLLLAVAVAYIFCPPVLIILFFRSCGGVGVFMNCQKKGTQFENSKEQVYKIKKDSGNDGPLQTVDCTHPLPPESCC
jgi:hypothetical protein